jgi:hypothetical protein
VVVEEQHEDDYDEVILFVAVAAGVSVTVSVVAAEELDDKSTPHPWTMRWDTFSIPCPSFDEQET